MNFYKLQNKVSASHGSEAAQCLEDTSELRNSFTDWDVKAGKLDLNDYVFVIVTIANWYRNHISDNKKSLAPLIPELFNHSMLTYELCNGYKSKNLAQNIAYEITNSTLYSPIQRAISDQDMYKDRDILMDNDLRNSSVRLHLKSDYYGPAVKDQEPVELSNDQQQKINDSYQTLVHRVINQCFHIEPVIKTMLEKHNHYIWLDIRDDKNKLEEFYNLYISLLIQAPWFKEPEEYVKDKLNWGYRKYVIRGVDHVNDHQIISSKLTPKLDPIPEMVALRKKIKHYKKTHPYYQKT